MREQADAPAEFIPFSGTLSEDGKTIAGGVQAGSGGGLVTVDPTSGADTEHPTEIVAVSYRRVNVELPAIERPPVHELVAKSAERTLIAATSEQPMGAKDAAPRVRLQVINGEPITFTEVAWDVQRVGGESLRATYYTVTDGAGETALQLSLLPGGDFAPANQVKKRPELTLPPGDYTVTAKAPRLPRANSRSFTVTLQGWPQIVFYSVPPAGEKAQPISSLVFQDGEKEKNFRITVIHRDLVNQPNAPEALKVDLLSSRIEYKNGQPQLEEWGATQVTLPRKGPGVYWANFDLIAQPGRVDLVIRTDRKILVPNTFFISGTAQDYADIRATVADYTMSNRLSVYGNAPAAAKDQYRQSLLQYRQLVADLRASLKETPPEEDAYLVKKDGVISRALAILEDDVNPAVPKDKKFDTKMQLILAAHYLRLVTANCHRRKVTLSPPGSEDDPDHPLARVDWRLDPKCYEPARGAIGMPEDLLEGKTRSRELPYELRDERQMLEKAAHERISAFWKGISDISAADLAVNKMYHMLAYANELVRVGLPRLLAEPVNMVHVMAFGTTLEGEDQTTIDRLLGGLEMASFRLGTVPRIAIGKELTKKSELVDELRLLNPGLSHGAGFDFDHGLAVLRAGVAEEMMEAQKFQAMVRILQMPVSDELKRRQLEVLDRVYNYKLMRNVMRTLETLGKEWRESWFPIIDRDELLARDLGHILHLVQLHENRVFCQWLLEQGQRVSTRKGRGYLDEVSRMEEMFEWTIVDVNGVVARKARGTGSTTPGRNTSRSPSMGSHSKGSWKSAT